MAFTRKDIRQRIGSAEFCADTIVAAASGNGSSTTLVDTSQKQPDDFFNSAQVVMVSGTSANIGLSRYVTDWVQSTSTYTLDRALTSSTATSDGYEVHNVFSYSDKNDAIKGAMRAGQTRWARRQEDTSLAFIVNTYTYSLASLSVPIDPDLGIDKVMYDTGVTGTGVPYATLDDDLWELRVDDTTYTLQVHDVPRVGATIRLVYRVRPSVLADDTTSVVPDSPAFFNYICAKATALLFRARALIVPEQDWADKAAAMDAVAESFYNLDKPQAQGGKVRFPAVSERRGDYFPIDYGL